MIKLLKRCYSLIYRWLKHLALFQQYKKVNGSISFNDSKCEIDIANKKTLVLIPHADDELIGCSQIINKNSDSMIAYFFNFYGGNEKNKQMRLIELKNYAESKRLHLEQTNGDYVEELCRIILNNEIEYIFLPSFIDWHVEHIQVNEILKDVIDNIEISKHLKIGMYSISVPLDKRLITHYSAMSKIDVQEKWADFNHFYVSQRHLPSHRFKYQERLDGNVCNTYAAECYSIHSYTDWLDLFDSFLNIRPIMNKTDITNMVLVREKSKGVAINLLNRK